LLLRPVCRALSAVFRLYATQRTAWPSEHRSRPTIPLMKGF
jgi:hypothetical protein